MIVKWYPPFCNLMLLQYYERNVEGEKLKNIFTSEKMVNTILDYVK